MHAERRSFVGPVALSVSLHGLLVALLLLGGRFTWPAPPIPIELQPPAAHRSTQRTGEERRGDPQTQPKAACTRPAGAAAAQPKPITPLPPSTQDLRPYAPDDANLVVLLRSDKLRKSPHRGPAEQLLAALPDYATLLSGTGLSPIDDFEALLIATANPRDVTATFLAVRFSDSTSAKIHAIGDHPLRSGDPRLFRFPAPGLAVLLRPDQALRLDERPDAGVGDSRTRWLKQLAQFERAASGAGGPAILVTLSDLPSLVRFGAELPTPQTVALALTADGSPLLHLKAGFLVEGDAARLAAQWPEILRRYRSDTALFGLSTALDDLKLTRSGAQLDLEGRIPEPQLRIALALVVSFLPRAPAPPEPDDGGIR